MKDVKDIFCSLEIYYYATCQQPKDNEQKIKKFT